jgi:hypothetical protein
MIRSLWFGLLHTSLLAVLLGYSLYEEWGLWRSVGPWDVWLVVLAAVTGSMMSGMTVWHWCASRPTSPPEITLPERFSGNPVVLPFPGRSGPLSRRS